VQFLKNLFKKKKPQYQYHRLSLSSSDIRKIQDEWLRVEELVKIGQPSQLRQAVIKADNLLDFALSKLTTGTTTGERLKNARPYYCAGEAEQLQGAKRHHFKDYAIYQGLWDAHKVRNALVHAADYEPMYTVTGDAVAKIKRGLEALGTGLSNPKGS
jgi:hypothetical protein